MNWKKNFRDSVLERGQNYYNRNRVQGLSCDSDVYRARVLGVSDYNVEIKIQDDDVADMKCSCPYAAVGMNCKHMAAVMFAIDAEQKSGKTVRKENVQTAKSQTTKVQTRQGQERPAQTKAGQRRPVQAERVFCPFKRSTENYQYFDMGRIAREFEFTESDFVEAMELARKGKVVLASVETGYRQLFDESGLIGEAQGHYQDERFPGQITIIFDRDKILRAACGVPRCGGRYENIYYFGTKNICKHLLALMILLDEYLKTYNPGDSTDMEAESLLHGFRDRHFRAVTEQQAEQLQDLRLEAVLERERDGVFASFKAGTDKLYVVKKLTEFVSLYEKQDMVCFGTKTEIDLAKHRMDELSKAVFEYVRRIVKDEQERVRFGSTDELYAADAEIKNRVRLYGERLDDFYRLYEGQTVSCSDKSSGKTVKIALRFQEGKPDIYLRIEKNVDDEQVFHGVKVSGELPELIEGNKYRYYFADGAFCRMSEEMAGDIGPLLEMAKDGAVSFRVGRKYLSEFYHQVLPVLKRNITVEETGAGEVQEYIPPEAVFGFYLDVEDDRIVCKPRVLYGETVVSLLDLLRADRPYESFRNRSREEEILYYLHQLFQEVDLSKDEVYCEDSEDAMLKLLDGGVERLMTLGEVHSTDRFRNINIRKKAKIKVGVSIKSDVMNLSISSEDLAQEELLQILQSYQRKKKYYRLKNGDFAEVNETDIETLSRMMEDLHLSPKDFVRGNMQIPAYRALYLNKMLEQSENIYLNRDSHFKKLVKEFKTVDDSDFEVPASLAPIMRNYQVRGFKWMKTLEHYGFGGILADDMGLGKTLQMISVLLSAKESGEEGTALVVCPASLVYNWKMEFARFAPELKVTLIVGSQQERAMLIRKYRESDVLVTSYDLLKRDVAEYEGAEFSYQVLDEAQYIKNHGTAAAKTVKVINSRHRYALTGTPIENRLSELWSIFDYLMPGFLYGYETFRKELETPIVKSKKEEASQRLKKMVSPFILRRLKTDVLKDLPEKIEEIRYAKLETEQQRLYDGQVLHMREMIASQRAEDFQKDKLEILAELTKIRQICCDPELLFEHYNGESAKRTACIELIQSAIEGEHKILVFSQFTSMLELLEHDLNEKNISFYKIVGATPKEERLKLVNAFNGDDTPVFLISLKAGGTGLNLTGADVVIHYDPWWNQSAQNQATDRAHRIGQTRAVSVYKLIAKDTIEEKIVKMQETKRELADMGLSGENGGITRMSREELMELLG